MKLTHLGHACLLVETGGARLLIDPGTMSTFEDVRDLDAVLVTHQHPDHVDASRLMALLAASCQKLSVPPTTWTESGQTPALQEVSSPKMKGEQAGRKSGRSGEPGRLGQAADSRVTR